ncbi:universal stress protein [Psychroflexus tropicus]|uniref:universal stress protein n=1 Tax=Psychroflexus tropicus TaxID=197345 RepID=UPI00035F14DD|nr:universal stress protein [Psychroflexus tropicus]
MKNILALTDFSENSLNAIHYALQLFEGDSLSFYILHCKEPDSTYSTVEVIASGNESFYDSLLKEVKQQLDELISKLKLDYNIKSVSFHPLVAYDSLTDAVKSVIESKDIQLSVMGTNGVTNAKEVVFGSNTVKMIRNITHPILAIPSEFKFNPIQNTVLPLHDYDKMSDNSFRDIVKFIKQVGGKVHALRICPKGEAPLEARTDEKVLTSFLDPVPFEYHAVHNIPLEYVVDCFIQTHDIDLILLLVKSEGFFKRFFMGSSTNKITNDLRVPLMVFPN